VDARSVHFAGRRAVRLADIQLSRSAHRRSRLAVRPGRDLLPESFDGRLQLEGHHAAAGVAYDLFGNGKTAVKFNIGKYLEAITASNNDLDMNPIIRIATTSTRTWDDFTFGPATREAGTSSPIAT
jgi:hypothetical protein